MGEHVFDILLTQRFPPEYGGAVRWVFETYRRWPRPVYVVTHDYYNAPPHTSAHPDIPHRPPGGDHGSDPNFTIDRRDIFLHNWGVDHPSRLIRYWRMAHAVWQQLRLHECVRVHCRDSVPEVVSLLPLRRLYGSQRLKIISYAHGEELTSCASSRQLRMLLGKACDAVDLMICNSKNTMQLLNGRVDSSRVSVIHPGVDVAAFQDAVEKGAAWRRAQGIGPEKLVILSVARLDPRKNQKAIIAAVAKLAPRFANIVFYAAGVGHQLEVLKGQANELGIADRVVFAGRVDEATKRAMYAGCDIFAMPSIRAGSDMEGFGIVFLEAGACGKPSIAGCDGGQAEAVIDGQTGFVVDGQDHDAVAGAIEKLAADDILRLQMGDQAHAHVQQFDWHQVVGRIVDRVDAID